MGNGINRNLSMRQQTRSALQRIEAIEQMVPQIISSINEAMGQNEQRMAQMADVLDVIIDQFGKDVIEAALEAKRKARVEEATATAKANLEAGLKDGRVLNAEVVSERSLIVGAEYDKDGQVLHPGRVQLTMAGVKPEFREKLLGQKPGVEIPIETTGGKFVLTEVYDLAEPKAEEAEAAPAPIAIPVEDAPTTPAEA